MNKLIRLFTLHDDLLGEIKVILKNDIPKAVVINKQKLDKFKILALAVYISKQDKEKALRLLNFASSFFHSQNDELFDELYSIVFSYVNYDVIGSD